MNDESTTFEQPPFSLSRNLVRRSKLILSIHLPKCQFVEDFFNSLESSNLFLSQHTMYMEISQNFSLTYIDRHNLPLDRTIRLGEIDQHTRTAFWTEPMRFEAVAEAIR